VELCGDGSACLGVHWLTDARDATYIRRTKAKE
jgi:hypothetical protein